jgi:3-hydroxyisobutyrate dehydrogenase-like beta-hydroxyacid dehydrogenase
VREAVVEADAVISMLPNGAIVRAVYEQVIGHAPPMRC